MCVHTHTHIHTPVSFFHLYKIFLTFLKLYTHCTHKPKIIFVKRENFACFKSISGISQMAVVQIPGITLEPVQKPHLPKIGSTTHLSLVNFFQLHKPAHMSSLGCLPSSSLWTDHLPPWNEGILCWTLSHEKWKWRWKSVMSNSLWPHELSQWKSPGRNTGVYSLSLLQGSFPTQGSNPGLPHCRWIHYQLSHKEAQEYWSG